MVTAKVKHARREGRLSGPLLSRKTLWLFVQKRLRIGACGLGPVLRQPLKAGREHSDKACRKEWGLERCIVVYSTGLVYNTPEDPYL
jgi:hypothetical protein